MNFMIYLNNPKPKFTIEKTVGFFKTTYSLILEAYDVTAMEDKTFTIFEKKKFENRRSVLSYVCATIPYCLNVKNHLLLDEIPIKDYSGSYRESIGPEEYRILGDKHYQYKDLKKNLKVTEDTLSLTIEE